jgi:signal transduction histidine kinase
MSGGTRFGYPQVQLAAILRSITDGITVQDATGALIYANDAAARIVGYASAAEFLATPIEQMLTRFDVYREDGTPLALADLPGRKALGGVEAELTLRFRVLATGETRWSTVRAMPVLDETGRVVQAVNVFRDITDRRALEDERQRMFEDAQQAVRDREQLMAVLSHDLRNPLSTISMATELLLRSAAPELAEKAKRASDNVQRAVRRMERLVHDLLDLARIEGGGLSLERTDHDVAQLVAEAMDLHTSLAADRNLTLVNEADGPARASCDRERILQLLSNLVDNALKFTPEGGSIRLGVKPDGERVTAWVADDGPGIPDEQRGQIFERFWQARRDRKGLGLGLAIARGVVEAHGGRIWVESTPGRGAKFLFSLPGGQAPGV